MFAQVAVVSLLIIVVIELSQLALGAGASFCVSSGAAGRLAAELTRLLFVMSLVVGRTPLHFQLRVFQS